MPALELLNVTKRFHRVSALARLCRMPPPGPEVTALRGVSVSASEGELLAVVGPNGAGKTTLLKIAAGLILPDAGAVRVAGAPPDRTRRAITRMLGIAAGDPPGFYDRLTGRENLRFFAALHGLGRAAASRRIEETLARLELEAPERRYQEYSAGTKQRLLVARALLHDPAVLLLDEPTRSLDPAGQLGLRRLLTGRFGAAERRTIVFTTHQPEEAALADRVAVLIDGTLSALGAPASFGGPAGLAGFMRRPAAPAS
ncbi:MAG TPA: ABC transporter ATP-binding protein [bacterium]